MIESAPWVRVAEMKRPGLPRAVFVLMSSIERRWSRHGDADGPPGVLVRNALSNSDRDG